jgi:glyoxylase-like metal-dependent hydrolase (beta-lactamase superfamily II)/rhodanese-related sulfurtransferase
MMQVLPVDTPTLGDRSYLVHDGSVALVVDPQRDIDRMLGLAARAGVRITHVFETHLHNDYVTGGHALARLTGAAYGVAAAEDVSFPRVPVSDGDGFTVGAMRVRALATPGHTFHHLAYAVEVPGREPAVFTGGSLLYGATGRPDLLGLEHAEELAGAQYATAHRLVDTLPPATRVYPTHGFGSFCSTGQSEATSSTLREETRGNPVLTQERERWVRELLDGLDVYPAYYAHMGSRNAAGPEAADLTPARAADPGDIARRIAAGEWVVDLRNRRAFAGKHAFGSLNFGLDGSLATYLGWLVPWGMPVTLVGESAQDVADAQRELSRIGIDRPACAAHGPVAAWGARAELTGYAWASFADLAVVRHHRLVVLLDVRRDSEWLVRRLVGAVHIPLHELLDRMGELPRGEVWVHCASGYRASIAASVVHASGRRVVLIDDDLDAVPDGARLVASARHTDPPRGRVGA